MISFLTYFACVNALFFALHFCLFVCCFVLFLFFGAKGAVAESELRE